MQQKFLAYSVRNALLAVVGTALALAAGAACAGTPTATGGIVPAAAAVTTSDPAATTPKPQDDTKAKKQENKKAPVQLQGVTVSAGIQASQQRSIDIKRNAPNIEDSITAVNIDSIQPNYGTLPAAMFSGVDVFKSPTASMLDSGISGTVNLRTYQPFDFNPGWSVTASAEGARGSVTKKNGPTVDTTINFNDGGIWGALLSASYSDLTRNNSSNGFYDGGRIGGENVSDANNTANNGFISGWGSVP